VFLMNDGNLTIDRNSSNKSFLATEIKRLILEHRTALQVLSKNKSLMKLYRETLEDLD
jgi:hypothetical protein